MREATFDLVYNDFRERHYVRTPIRTREHVRAILGAAHVSPGRITPDFWTRRVTCEWLWGVSPEPFQGHGAGRANARYQALCERKGVRP
jgi:hypothetical protein